MQLLKSFQKQMQWHGVYVHNLEIDVIA